MSGTALALWLAAGACAPPEAALALARAREAAFASRVREATERYRDREAAATDGYRLIGDDFPGMGEHWIQTDLVFDGVYEPTRPEMLSYVTIDGVPQLLGIAYALPLLADVLPPEAPAGRAAWHAHTGSLDDETLAPHHHQSGHADHGPRLAMVHAWVWLENPEGMFAADNWAIPFLRLGLAPPPRLAPAAGKALSLLSGSGAYGARVVRAAVSPAAPDEAALQAAIARGSTRARSVLERRSGPQLPPGSLEELAAAWGGMWDELESMLPADAVLRLASQSLR